MSVENLKEYARRCATDPELRAAAKTIGMTDIEEHIHHAGSLGLDWTKDDLVAFRKEVTGDDGTGGLVDLTEEELEQIAGGFVTITSGVALVAAGVGAGVAAGVATAAVVGGVVAGTTAASGQGGW